MSQLKSRTFNNWLLFTQDFNYVKRSLENDCAVFRLLKKKFSSGKWLAGFADVDLNICIEVQL